MNHCGYVTTLKNLRPHPNADRLQLADCFGNTICVSLDAKLEDIGIYFPVDLQLSEEFCKENNLVRLYDENGHAIPGGGYLDPEKRNIRAIRLRGERSEGIFCPLESVAYTGINLEDLHIGDTIQNLNGHEICCKYIPKSITRVPRVDKKKARKINVAPLFTEHVDTSQLAYCLNHFKSGDEIEISLKLHGTSHRTGYLPVLQDNRYSFNSLFLATCLKFLPTKKLRHKFGEKFGSPVYDYDYVSGTRRTVLDTFEGGFYGNDAFRKKYHDFFKGKLWKGETVYAEIVGFVDDGKPIMASCDNKVLNNKEFTKVFGPTTVFSYGCEPNGVTGVLSTINNENVSFKPQNDIYVYRMTMTNEDGNVVEYSPDFMRYRCEMMGVKTPPVYWKGTVLPSDNESAGDFVLGYAEHYCDGVDPIGKTHVKEGVVVRVVNKPTFTAYKHKNFEFKVISGIISEAVANGVKGVDSTVLDEL